MDKKKLNQMFLDWQLHGEDWGETEIVASWESRQSLVERSRLVWLTKEVGLIIIWDTVA